MGATPVALAWIVDLAVVSGTARGMGFVHTSKWGAAQFVLVWSASGWSQKTGKYGVVRVSMFMQFNIYVYC